MHRVYGDRLVNETDSGRFDEMVARISRNFFEDIDNDELHKLPLTFTKVGLEIIVRDADVDFLTENAVRIRADADVSGYGLAGSAIADMTTSITYRDGDFFLTSVAFDDIKFIQDAATEEKLEDGNSVARGLFNTMRDAIADGETGVGAALDRVADRAMDPLKNSPLQPSITTRS